MNNSLISSSIKHVFALAIVLLGVFIWLPYTSVDFMNEDFLVILWQNPQNFGECFQSFIVPYGYYYRPVVHVLYALTYFFFGFSAEIFHWQNIIFHLAGGVMIYYLSLEFMNRYKALFVGLLFITLSSHIPAVAWIAGRTDALLSFFLMFGFYIFYRNYRYPEKATIFKYIMAAFCFLLAILSKELAYAGALLPILLLIETRDKRTIKISFIAIGISIAIIFLTLGFRSFIGSNPFTSTNFSDGFSIVTTIRNFIAYIALQFMSPEKLENLYTTILPSISNMEYRPIIFASLALILLSMVIVLFIKSENKKQASFGLGWYLIMIAPALSVLHRWYVYGASIGTLIFLVALLENKTKGFKTYLSYMIFITLLYYMTFSVKTIQEEARKWQETGVICSNILQNTAEEDIDYPNYKHVRLWASPDKYQRINLLKTAPAMALGYAFGHFNNDMSSPIRCEIINANFQIEYNYINDTVLHLHGDNVFFFPRGKQKSSIHYTNHCDTIGNMRYKIISNGLNKSCDLFIENVHKSNDTLDLIFIGKKFIKI